MSKVMVIKDDAGNTLYQVGWDRYFTRAAAEHVLWLREQLRKVKS